ncbi:blood vessel epicardial substance-A isoform X2 [Cryptotermes secundus]|uniref:blood vessel epicardial substance-A isoform X2 n=1 Tax=Cryptotermes secundus TaxID=105785 RepID=UPI000CD7B8BA|nr:blood vessel epicardial substance-A isoform X2 [Cryptotermes secundus]
MEKVPNTTTPTEVGSSDVSTRSRNFSTSVFLPADSDGGVDQEKGVGGVAVTPQDMGSTSSKQSITTTLPPSPTPTPVTDNFTEFTVWTEEFWNSSATPTLSLLVTTQINLANDTNVSVATDLIPEEGDASCVEWEAAQHNLFQTANLFFAAAFIVPRSFKQSLLLLRAFLCVGFFLSALWAGIHVCAPDAFAWSVGLVFLNAVHTALLACRFLPPPLSLELTELYLKLFKPLRVSKKHFKELTREGQLMHLEPGETYAVEEVTPADERLSVLLKGKLRVTCDDMHLHYVQPHQFIDSPEWEANHDNSDDVFQVTITAEQECLYMCWPRLKLERVLRHRPLLKVVLSNIIGKDITHKLYSLNEHLGAVANSDAASNALGRQPDHWRAMNRSLSVDAVHTGTRGHVRSLAWRAQQQRRTSATYSDRSTSPSRLQQQQCWVPVVANHFPANSPFSTYPHAVITTTAAAAVATVVTAATTSAAQQFTASPPIALVPVVVPVLAPPPAPINTRSRSIRRSGGREVKFETPV